MIDYPRNGFDKRWRLRHGGPLPVPVWMWDGRYTGGHTLFDASGRGNHGTFVGDPGWVATDAGMALLFDATDHVAAVQLPSMSAYTVVHWFRVSATPIGLQILSDLQFSGDDGARLNFNNANGRIYFSADDGTFSSVLTTGTLKIGEWNFCVAVIDGDYARVYLNGEPAVSASGNTFNFAGATRQFEINSRNGGAYEFVGEQRFIAVFNQALTPSQIQLLYTSQYNGGPGVLARKQSAAVGSGDTLKRYWVGT